MPHVEHDARPKTPFEWHRVDPPGRLSLRGRTIVIRRVDMRPVVAADGEILDSPAFTARVNKMFGPGPERLHHPPEAAIRMRHIFNLWLEHLPSRFMLKRHAQVNQSQLSQ